MKKTHSEFGDFAPKISNKPKTDALLIAGISAMIVMCGIIFISVVLIGY